MDTNNEVRLFRIAILDMYKGEPNQGMRNIREIIERFALDKNIIVEKKFFDVRNKMEVPGLEFDAYISTGGPGSPVDPEGWENDYLELMHSIILHNEKESAKKYVFLICHSFQVFCYHFKLARVCLRKSESFGTFPMHRTHQSKGNVILERLQEVFYAVDSRKWQVIQPNYEALRIMGAKILAIEKERPHVPYERATMMIQFTHEIIGTQFHPEAGPKGMIFYLKGEKKEVVIKNYGLHKYNTMLQHLEDPDKIRLTQRTIIPTFLDQAYKMSGVNSIAI